MQAERWSRVKQLFEACLDLPASDRTSFLESRCGDAELKAEVLSLLAVHDDDPAFLDGATPAIDSRTLTMLDAHLSGKRVGPWKLKREVGRGGMGVVWEAERNDGEFEQRVAIKFVQQAVAGEIELARMRGERQILAGLNHPGIATLLDGGTTADGYPYLVMEFIDGEPLDAWCERNGLSVRQRLELFLRVCAAVEFAHRRLVVHRDLKPGNILVTAEGSPKLLDFGIAKLLDADSGRASDSTRTAAVLTPDYASPEQVRGEAVTTATDIYSLGVVLYVLLTGRKPYVATGPLGLMRAISDEDPKPPSVHAPADRRKTVKGELDAIVMQALRKNPDERYASAGAFAADVRAWLEGRTVTAHPATPWQRVRKLVLRHKGASVAVAAAMLAVATGAGTTLWQAHVARTEHARAENRFREVRQFSRSLLFEVHDSIRALPGATAPRALLLERATQFLDGLARDAGSDVALKVELAEGYRRLGHVLGSAVSDNLGRREEAIAAYRKSARMAESALAAAPDNVEAQLVLSGAFDDLTDAHLMKGDYASADSWFAKHRDLIRSIDAKNSRDAKTRSSVATSFASLGYYTAQRNDLAGAKALYEMAIPRFSALYKEGDRSRQVRSQYPFALKRLGAILISEGDLEQAERRYLEALAIEDGIVAEAPSNMRTRIDRTFTLSDLALIQKRRGRMDEAVRGYEDVLATRKAALESDPSNQRYISLTSSVLANLASLYTAQGRHAEAIKLCREGVLLRDRGVTSTDSFRERISAAAGRIKLAEAIAAHAETLRDGALRRKAAEEGAQLLKQVGGSIGALKRNENLTPFDRAVLSDSDAVQQRIARLLSVSPFGAAHAKAEPPARRP
jgi:non-specific serine/threonine protein kinase/serine/threonine-protein kinase